MKKHLISHFLFTFVLLCSLTVYAQEKTEKPTRELGIASTGFNDSFSLVYKKEIAENRYRVYSGQLDLNLFFAESSINSLFTSFSIGTENRKYLNEKIKFVRGPAFGLGLGLAEESNLSLIPFFNYQLGVQYDISDLIYIGVSAFPTVSLLILPGEETPISLLNVSANTSAQLSAVFRF